MNALFVRHSCAVARTSVARARGRRRSRARDRPSRRAAPGGWWIDRQLRRVRRCQAAEARRGSRPAARPAQRRARPGTPARPERGDGVLEPAARADRLAEPVQRARRRGSARVKSGALRRQRKGVVDDRRADAVLLAVRVGNRLARRRQERGLAEHGLLDARGERIDKRRVGTAASRRCENLRGPARTGSRGAAPLRQSPPARRWCRRRSDPPASAEMARTSAACTRPNARATSGSGARSAPTTRSRGARGAMRAPVRQ